MRKLMFALLPLAFALFGTQCWATTVTCFGPTSSEGTVTCTNTFSPGTDITGVYDFTGTGDGVLTVHFVTVLPPGFTLIVTVAHPTNPLPLDPNEFPADTVCVPYSSNFNRCDRYDFSGPNGVPVRNVDYKGLITLTLSYYYTGPVHTPAFGHAPGDITTFTEDILKSYSTFPTGCVGPSCDPTMDGDTPGLSSVIALDEPFAETGDSFCSLSLQTPPFQVGQQIEVDFRLTNGTDCSTGIRDKTARSSLSMRNSSGFPVLVDKEEGNKFHWDNKDGVNEFDLSTVGLTPGDYTITVFSSKVSPHSVSFTLLP